MGDHVERYLQKLTEQDRYRPKISRAASKKNIGKRTGKVIPGIGGIADISGLFRSFGSDTSDASSTKDTPLHSTLKAVPNEKRPPSPPTYFDSDTDGDENDIVGQSKAEEGNLSNEALQPLITTFVDQGTQYLTPEGFAETRQDLSCGDHRTLQKLPNEQIVAGNSSRDSSNSVQNSKKKSTRLKKYVKDVSSRGEKSQSDIQNPDTATSDSWQGISFSQTKSHSDEQSQANTGTSQKEKSSTPQSQSDILSRYKEMIHSEKTIIHDDTKIKSITSSPSLTPKQSRQSILRKRLSFKASAQSGGSPRPTVTMYQSKFSTGHSSFELDDNGADDVIVEANDPEAQEKIGLANFPTPKNKNLSLLKRRPSSAKKDMKSGEVKPKQRQTKQKSARKSTDPGHKNRHDRKTSGSGKKKKYKRNLFQENGAAAASAKRKSASRPNPKSKKSLDYPHPHESRSVSHRSSSVVDNSVFKLGLPRILVDYSTSDDSDEDYVPVSLKKKQRKSVTTRSKSEKHSGKRDSGVNRSLRSVPRSTSFKSDNDADDSDDASDRKSKKRHSTRLKTVKYDANERPNDSGVRRHISLFYSQSSSESEDEQPTVIQNISRRTPLSASNKVKKAKEQRGSELTERKRTSSGLGHAELFSDVNHKNKHSPENILISKPQPVVVSQRRKRMSKSKSGKKGASVISSGLQAWLDSGHDKSGEIKLRTPENPKAKDTKDVTRSTVIDRRSRQIDPVSDAASTELSVQQSKVDYPPLPSVDESAISTSGGRSRRVNVRDSKFFGPAASTPRRVRKVQKLTTQNLIDHDRGDLTLQLNDDLNSEAPYGYASEIAPTESDNPHETDTAQRLSDIKGQKDVHNSVSERTLTQQNADEASTERRRSSDTNSAAKETLDGARKRHLDSPAKSVIPPKSPRKAVRSGGKTKSKKRQSKREKPKRAQDKTISDNERTVVGESTEEKLNKKDKAHTNFLEFLHEQKLDIVVPEEETELRRSKRVRPSRPLGFGEKLVYSERDKNGVRSLLGIQTKSGFIPINTHELQGETIHIEPSKPKEEKKRRKKGNSQNRTKNVKNNNGAVKKVSSAKEKPSTRKVNDESTARSDKEKTSWFDDMRSSSIDEVASDSGETTQNGNKTIQIVDSATGSYVLADLSSVVVCDSGRGSDSLYSFNGVSISRGITNRRAAQGKLTIEPRKKKNERIINNGDMFFSVAKGRIELVMGAQTIHVRQGGYFVVPCKNQYSMYNPSNRVKAEMFYTMVRTEPINESNSRSKLLLS